VYVYSSYSHTTAGSIIVTARQKRYSKTAVLAPWYDYGIILLKRLKRLPLARKRHMHVLFFAIVTMEK